MEMTDLEVRIFAAIWENIPDAGRVFGTSNSRRAIVSAALSALRPGDVLPGGLVVEQAGAVSAIRAGLNLRKMGVAHRHKETGAVYYVCGECLIEATATPAILYRSETGAVWCRPKDEFFDGRFELLLTKPKEGE